MIEPVPLGTKDSDNLFAEQSDTVAILPEVRWKHMAVFGATGSGKSTLLRNMIAWDIASGAGVTVVDPHGGLIDDILDNHIPKCRVNDVIYFNPKDQQHALAMNILECQRPEPSPFLASFDFTRFGKS